METKTGTRWLLVGAATLLISACQNGAGPVAARPRTLSLSVVADQSDSTASNTPLSTASSGQSMTLSDTTDTLVLSSVQIVVRQIELAQADTSCSPSYEEDAQGSEGDTMGVRHEHGDHMGEWGHDGCQEVKVGPVLVDVPLDGQVRQVFAAQLPAGTYDGAELRIHSPVPADSTDAAFLADHPSFDSVSVRVQGTYDDSAFTYTHRIEARQAYRLNPPLVVTPDSGASNLTLRVDVGAWFVRRDGTLIDPAMASAGGEDEHLVAWNIVRSLWTFKDDNHDGRCDRH